MSVFTFKHSMSYMRLIASLICLLFARASTMKTSVLLDSIFAKAFSFASGCFKICVEITVARTIIVSHRVRFHSSIDPSRLWARLRARARVREETLKPTLVARFGRRTHLPAVELALGRHGNARVRRFTLMLQSTRPVRGRNVAHRQSHRRTHARSPRRGIERVIRLSHASTRSYLWNVAENRFFRSLPLAPFFTNFAALLALFTFSSARDAPSNAIRQSKALSRGRPHLPPTCARARRSRRRHRRAIVARDRIARVARIARTFRRRHRSCARGKDGADAARADARAARTETHPTPRA
jgi:hypothetical protein